jgi:hypothetical protein
MVSWGKAYGTAVKIVLIVIVWYILGAAISVGLILMFGNLAILSGLSNPTVLLNHAGFIQQLGKFIASVFIAWVIGATISGLGGVATFLKYSAELCADEIEAKTEATLILDPTTSTEQVTPSSPKICPSCSAQILPEFHADEAEEKIATVRFVSAPSGTVKPLTIARLRACHSCGEANTTTASYCRNCGAELLRF